jgi:hypothetical protein
MIQLLLWDFVWIVAFQGRNALIECGHFFETTMFISGLEEAAMVTFTGSLAMISR